MCQFRGIRNKMFPQSIFKKNLGFRTKCLMTLIRSKGTGTPWNNHDKIHRIDIRINNFSEKFCFITKSNNKLKQKQQIPRKWLDQRLTKKSSNIFFIFQKI